MDIRHFNPGKYVSSLGTWRPVDASGGVESFITVSGVRYKLHVFTDIGSTNLIVNSSGSDGLVEYLVVAGGGGGGMDMGGGGGGGGVLTGRHVVGAGEILPITLGSGGMGAPGGSRYRVDGVGPNASNHQFTISATNGENSTFGPYTAIGGGYGGSSYYNYTPNNGNGNTGGCGGGNSGYSNGGTIASKSGTTSQGFRGGRGGGQYYSGGGGGANGPGVNSTARSDGGQGSLSNILGYNLYWGGGGGGSAYSLGTGGYGGIGGGGGGAVGTAPGGAGYNIGQAGLGGSPNSQTNTRGGSAGTNTGGGGGGGSHYNANNDGGNGGSGIVVVRYPTSGKLTSYITQNLMLYLDARNPASYSGSGTTWADISGNGYNATLINSPTHNAAGYFSFNGSNQTASIATNPNIYGVISCEIWVYMNNITSYPCLLHKGGHYSLQIAGTNTYYWADSSTYNYASYGLRTATGIGATGVWKQIVSTKDSSNNVKIYINGVLTDTRTGFGDVIVNNTSTLWIVGYSDTTSIPTGNLLNGNVSLCRIYNRELTQSEIINNFNADRSSFGI